jgi:hypothetical protein
MAYSKIDSLVYKYRDFSIYNFGNFTVSVGKNQFPNEPEAPKRVQEAVNAYLFLPSLITFDELVEVCQEARDRGKNISQSYLQ